MQENNKLKVAIGKGGDFSEVVTSMEGVWQSKKIANDILWFIYRDYSILLFIFHFAPFTHFTLNS